MNILVIGKGGREHALVWKLARCQRAEKVFCAPGNAGTASDGINVPIQPQEVDELIKFVRKENIGLTVVGPEDPLAAGIVDKFQKQELRIFGPTKEAAKLEASKVFAKNMMRHADLPTADFVVFDHPEPARTYIRSREYVILPDGRHITAPFERYQVVVEDGVKYIDLAGHKVKISPPERLVVKADGLAAGKGVFVCSTTEEALAAIDRIMVREEFGREAGRKVVIERRLEGAERSLLALVAGRAILPLPPTLDYKRAQDNDQGPNTGGMGALCPVALPDELTSTVDRDVFVPIVHAMRRKLTPFRGLLYAGLMLTNQGPRVLEFNCRFGDPEAQPLLMRLKTDLLDLLEAVIEDRLDEFAPDGLEWDPRPAVCVVMCSGGYPGRFEKGHVIYGLDKVSGDPDLKVFHAGTKLDGRQVLTDGGRVLGVTALADTVEEARQRVYAACGLIQFRGAFYRRDIGLPPAPLKKVVEPD